MKHKIQTLITLSLVIGLLTLNVSAASFSDVSEGDWYADAVEYVVDAGIMVGDDQGSFNPDNAVTRAEMAVVVCRLLERTRSEEEYLPIYLVAENYSDVPENHWANGYINRASYLEIIKGYGNGRFGPSDRVTYEQAVTMLVRALGKDADAAGRGGYPNGFLAVAKDAGLLSGVRAAAGEELSRANVAVLLSNYYRMELGDNTSLGENFVNTPENEVSSPSPESSNGNETRPAPTPDEGGNGSLEIGDSQQEEQPGSGSEDVGVGGGV